MLHIWRSTTISTSISIPSSNKEVQVTKIIMVSFAPSTIADFNGMKQKIQDILHVYDGEVKSYGELDDAFDDLFHEAFEHDMDGINTIDRNQIRVTANSFLSMGTSVDILLYKRLCANTFEIKLHFVNRLVDTQTHLKGTIEDGRLIKIEAHKEVEKRVSECFQAKNNFENFIQLQNDKGASVNDLEHAFNSLFYDSLIAEIGRTELHKRGMRTTYNVVPDEFPQSKFTLEKFELIGEQRVEVKVLRDCFIEDCKSTLEVWHDVFTLKDDTILAIEPCVDFKKGSAKKGEKLGKKDRTQLVGKRGCFVF
mmetsp:Transcript_9946/g.18159  ORF Transcript_9946/g.18159 Transcript_9946/m.18159 type:complete len:309 (-) Transcript_9946:415-1341(-)